MPERIAEIQHRLDAHFTPRPEDVRWLIEQYEGMKTRFDSYAPGTVEGQVRAIWDLASHHGQPEFSSEPAPYYLEKFIAGLLEQLEVLVELLRRAEDEIQSGAPTLQNEINDALASYSASSPLADHYPPPEDVERAAKLAQERGWKNIEPHGVVSDPAKMPDTFLPAGATRTTLPRASAPEITSTSLLNGEVGPEGNEGRPGAEATATESALYDAPEPSQRVDGAAGKPGADSVPASEPDA